MRGRGDFGYHLRHARVWCCGLALGIPGWDRDGGTGRWGGIGGRRRILGLYIGGYKRTPTRGMQRTRPGAREAHAVVPAFCCPLPTVPSPHLCADVVCNSAVSIHARCDTSAAVHSLSLTSPLAILVSSRSRRQDRGGMEVKGDTGLRLRHTRRRLTPVLHAISRVGRGRRLRPHSLPPFGVRQGCDVGGVLVRGGMWGWPILRPYRTSVSTSGRHHTRTSQEAAGRDAKSAAGASGTACLSPTQIPPKSFLRSSRPCCPPLALTVTSS
ncbi:hypothetical protein B0H14DRAFT_207128 [Mycena olivaceomarginata]|nr:hypothetical protein B0H14DRAFT_207128 [Mycena olivaceomarginata]